MRHLILLNFILVLFSCKNENSEHIRSNNSGNEIDISLSENQSDNDIYLAAGNFNNQEASGLNAEGIKYVRTFDYNKAEKRFKQALLIEPENPILLNNLGNISDLKNDINTAINFYEKSLINSDSTYLHPALNLGVIYYKTNRDMESIDLFKLVILKSKDKNQVATARFQLAKSYIEISECEKARTELKLAKNMLKDIPEFKNKFEYVEGKIENCVQQEL